MKVSKNESIGNHINISLQTIEESAPSALSREIINELEGHLGFSQGRLKPVAPSYRAHQSEHGLVIYGDFLSWGVKFGSESSGHSKVSVLSGHSGSEPSDLDASVISFSSFENFKFRTFKTSIFDINIIVGSKSDGSDPECPDNALNECPEDPE